MSSENYGALVKSLRQKMGLTQNQVAESLGVTPGYISNVENNRTAMSLRILTYYARLIGCSLDALVGELDSEYSETALDRKLYQTILKLDIDTKEKLLKTLEIWTKYWEVLSRFYNADSYNVLVLVDVISNKYCYKLCNSCKK